LTGHYFLFLLKSKTKAWWSQLVIRYASNQCNKKCKLRILEHVYNIVILIINNLRFGWSLLGRFCLSLPHVQIFRTIQRFFFR
jgi:hypothetical protein